jgi:hypothetical protein
MSNIRDLDRASYGRTKRQALKDLRNPPLVDIAEKLNTIGNVSALSRADYKKAKAEMLHVLRQAR